MMSRQWRGVIGGAVVVGLALWAPVSPGQAITTDGNTEMVRDAASSTYWCPMRGKPCGKVDYHAPGTCEDCGMALVTKEALEMRQEADKVDVKTMGIVLFRGFETLDVYGPVAMWGHVREFNLVTVAEEAGPIASAQGLATQAAYGFSDCPRLDFILVPGGMGTRREVNNEALLDFLRSRHEAAEITTSVCTGAALLAKAGVLDGHRATTNKRAFDWVVSQGPSVAWNGHARWVDDGDVITSSGVSAGMDMALHLVRRLFGEERARMIAAGAEYTWNDDGDNDPFAVDRQVHNVVPK